MKYIKKFENNNDRYKKYIVLNSKSVNGNYRYFIYEIYDIVDELVDIKLLFSYNNGEIIHFKNSGLRAMFDEIDKDLVYQSDDLDDVKKILPILYNQNKYNL